MKSAAIAVFKQAFACLAHALAQHLVSGKFVFDCSGSPLAFVMRSAMSLCNASHASSWVFSLSSVLISDVQCGVQHWC